MKVPSSGCKTSTECSVQLGRIIIINAVTFSGTLLCNSRSSIDLIGWKIRTVT